MGSGEVFLFTPISCCFLTPGGLVLTSLLLSAFLMPNAFFGGDVMYLLPYGLNIGQNKVRDGKCYGISFVAFYPGRWGRGGDSP